MMDLRNNNQDTTESERRTTTMKKLMNMAGLLLVVVLLAAVVVAVVATMREIKEAGEGMPVVALPERPVSPETITWETYTDPILGFSVKYPKGWYVQTHSGGGVSITSYDPSGPIGEKADLFVLKDQYRLRIYFVSDIKPAIGSLQDLEEWAIGDIKRGMYGDAVTIVSQEEILVDSILSLRVVEKTLLYDGSELKYANPTFVYIPKDGGVYVVSAMSTGSIYHPLLDEILKSIDFK